MTPYTKVTPFNHMKKSFDTIQKYYQRYPDRLVDIVIRSIQRTMRKCGYPPKFGQYIHKYFIDATTSYEDIFKFIDKFYECESELEVKKLITISFKYISDHKVYNKYEVRNDFENRNGNDFEDRNGNDFEDRNEFDYQTIAV